MRHETSFFFFTTNYAELKLTIKEQNKSWIKKGQLEGHKLLSVFLFCFVFTADLRTH